MNGKTIWFSLCLENHAEIPEVSPFPKENEVLGVSGFDPKMNLRRVAGSQGNSEGENANETFPGDSKWIVNQLDRCRALGRETGGLNEIKG